MFLSYFSDRILGDLSVFRWTIDKILLFIYVINFPDLRNHNFWNWAFPNIPKKNLSKDDCFWSILNNRRRTFHKYRNANFLNIQCSIRKKQLLPPNNYIHFSRKHLLPLFLKFLNKSKLRLQNVIFWFCRMFF